MNDQSKSPGSIAGRKLPGKTKAAMLFVFVVAGIGLIFNVVQEVLFLLPRGLADSWRMSSFGSLFLGLYVLPVALLFLKSKFAYIGSLSILSIYFFFSLWMIWGGSESGIGWILVGIFVIIPLTLVALDAKNYSRITR
jgi:hypothetical protein